jgi:hypothetical protein
MLPEGNHEVVFRFEPSMFSTGRAVDMASSLLIILLFVGWGVTEMLKAHKKENNGSQ